MSESVARMATPSVLPEATRPFSSGVGVPRRDPALFKRRRCAQTRPGPFQAALAPTEAARERKRRELLNDRAFRADLDLLRGLHAPHLRLVVLELARLGNALDDPDRRLAGRLGERGACRRGQRLERHLTLAGEQRAVLGDDEVMAHVLDLGFDLVDPRLPVLALLLADVV